MMRRDFLRRMFYGGTVLATTGGTRNALHSPSTDEASPSRPTPAALPFALEDITILDPDLLRMRRQTLDYMLALDFDRLLHNFRVNASLPSSAAPLYNRESPANGWRGHYVGHFLSASGQMYATTRDARIKSKADAIVAELAKCQARLGEQGYLSAFPESSFDDLEQGRPAAVIWYALHKIMAGLLDAHEHLQNQQALDVLQKMAAWVDWRTGRLPEDQMQRTLQTEFGGMNEVLANLSAVRKNPRYLEVAKRFDHHVVMDPAYVHVTRAAQADFADKKALLASRGVHTVGRYGGWTYCSIEDNIVESRALARSLSRIWGT